MTRREQHLFIPPDVVVNDDGTISQEDWPSVYRLNNNRNHYVLSFTGLGMPAIVYIDEQGPLQNGVTILDYRLQQRIVQYSLRVNGKCSRNDYWDKRGDLIDILRPNRQTSDTEFQLGRLRVVRPDGVTRDINAIIEQGPAFSARNPEVWDEWSFTDTLRFLCADPTFFDPDLVDVTWDVEVYKGWIFKSALYPHNTVFGRNSLFGSRSLSGQATVTYTGTILAYPIITITGPVSSPSITNQTLGTKIQLNYDIATGETVTINTTYGNKTIENNVGVNLIGTLSDDSDLNFYIAPHPYAEDGVNIFIAGGAGAEVGVTNLTMSYYTRYIGIQERRSKMTQRSWPWFGEAPGEGADAGAYEQEDWWPAWGTMMRAAAIIVESAGAPLRTLAALTNLGVFYCVDNKLEVTDAGGLAVDIDTGAAMVEGQFYYNDASIQLTLPASKTDWYVVLRKNYTAATFTPVGYVAGSGTVPPYTTRITWVSSLTQATDRSDYWDIPLAKFTTDGSDITALTDEREWVDVETKVFYVGFDGAEKTTPATVDRDLYGYAMAPNPSDPTDVWTEFGVPSDFLDNMSCYPIVIDDPSGGGAAANAQFDFWARYGTCGENYATHSENVLNEVISIPNNTGEKVCLTALELDLSDIALEDTVTITLHRDSTSGSDVYTGNVYAHIVRIEYLGWR